MVEFADRIKPSDAAITTYLDDLLASKYQIPTFQRDVVWEEDKVKRLWDSVFRFYPIGSILVWKTETKLQKHRQIGGFPIDKNFDHSEQQYLLDGQQRTTALLTALHGGKILGRDEFDPTLYLDLTIPISEEEDSYRRRFLFWNEIDDRNGQLLGNRGRAQRYVKGEIVKLHDIAHRYGALEETLHKGGFTSWDDPVRQNLRLAQNVLSNYRVSFIVLRGIQIAEVCQIFERINREGQPLDTFDIVVAKTYRPANAENGVTEFYLREQVDNLRKKIPSHARYAEVDDHTLLQILAAVIGKDQPDAGIHNITDRYLTALRTENMERSWPKFSQATLKAFDFLDQILHMKGPNLVPFRYLYMTIAAYFLKADKPDYDFLKRYFWYTGFHSDDLLSNTTQLQSHLTTLTSDKPETIFSEFALDKDALRRASYSTKGRLSRAILSLLSSRKPRDWASPYRDVVSDTYYMLTDKPNLHHIFPSNFIASDSGKNRVDVNSLMNIAYITQLTNIRISDKNPIDYIADLDTAEFRSVLQGHMVPPQILDWAQQEKLPDNALDQFVDSRVELFISALTDLLPNIPFRVFDSRQAI
jgi:hypothetical protein